MWQGLLGKSLLQPVELGEIRGPKSVCILYKYSDSVV